MRIILAIYLAVIIDVVMADQKPMSVVEFFNKATYENMETVCKEFYSNEIKFIDPLGEINGIEDMVKYYKNLYKNVDSIRFDAINDFEQNDERVFVWQMHLKHQKVGAGEPIVLDGVSVFKYEDGKVIYHRDYFDLGAMIYEKVPVLGSLIKWIKAKAHGD